MAENNKSSTDNNKCIKCQNYDRDTHKCKEYGFNDCEKINFTRCEGYMVDEKLVNF